MFVAPSAYTFGGVQTWLDYLLPALSDNGRDVTLGLVSGRFHDAKEYLRIHPFDNSYLIHLTTGTRQGRVQSLQKAIAECRPDIVVVVNIVDAYIAAALLRSQSTLDVRIAATLHGLQPDFLQDFETYRDQLDAVICTNRLAGAVVEEWSGLATDRIFYAPCGIEIPDSESGENSAAHSLLRVAYVGRLDHFQKRISDVVDIVRACVESGLALTLTVAGGGPEEDAFMASVDRAGLNDHVNFLGVLDQQQLRAQVYANSDVLLLTSSWETGPIVAWEAMAEGAVVVTSDYLGRKCEGSLEDGANCLVYPVGDIEGAVECLKKAQDRGIRNRLAGAGHDLVRNKYSRNESVRQWSDCLDQVGALPPLPRRAVQTGIGTQGRLDRLLGGRRAEMVRRLLGREFAHSEPGGEWPHSYGDRPVDDPEFWTLARRLDVSGIS